MSRMPRFVPRQRVIVCSDDTEEGGILGHYGTIVRILGKPKTIFPHQPYLWSYRVFVPYLNRNIDVPDRMLLAFDSFDESDGERETVAKIIFDKSPDEDNEEISGSYLFPGRGITYYWFRKTETPVAIYRLNMQTQIHFPESTLTYQVPQDVILNAAYVIQAIRNLLLPHGSLAQSLER